MKEKTESSVVKSFADLKDQKVEIVPSASELIMKIFKRSKGKEFNQKMIREKLAKIDGAPSSNPAINGALRKLAESGSITREVQGSHVFYRQNKED